MWDGIWWAMDAPYVLRMFFASYEATESECVAKTIDSFISNLTWVLEFQPERAFVCFDSGESERKKIDFFYKHGRPSPPAEYHGCYEALLGELDRNFSDRVEMVVSPGWEADDCLATVARRAVENGKKSVLMTADKDLRQCLRHGKVTLQRRVKDEFGRMVWQFFTAADCEKTWQIMSDRCVDFQILCGDDCDNIKGCKGIGPQRASQLLIENGSVEKMKTIDSFPSLPRNTEEDLIRFLKKDEPVVRQLVTLRDDLMLFNPMTQAVVIL